MKRVVASFLLMTSVTFSSTDDELLDTAANSIETRQFAKALRLYETLLVSHPFDTQLLFNKARILSWMNEYKESIDVYNKLIALTPHNGDARLGLAYVYFWQRKYDLADKQLASIFYTNPGNIEALLLRGRVCLAERRFTDALSFFETARYTSWLSNQSIANPLKVVENHSIYSHIVFYTQFAKASLYIEKGWLEQAQSTLEEMQRTTDVLIKLGSVLAWRGKYEEAKGVLQEALLLSEMNCDALYMLAKIAYWEKNTEEGLTYTKMILACDPTYADTQKLQTRLLTSSDRSSPEETSPRVSYQAEYEKARQYYFEQQYDLAVQKILHVLKHEPENLDARLLYGKILLAQEKTSEAKAVFLSVLEEKPNDVLVKRALGNIAFLEGRYVTAYTTFSELKKSDPEELLFYRDVIQTQPFAVPYFFVVPFYANEKEKDLLTGEETTKITTFSIDSAYLGQIAEQIKPLVGFSYFIQRQSNLIRSDTNYAVNAFLPKIGLRVLPTHQIKIDVLSTFARYTSGSSSALFPFDDEFVWQPSLNATFHSDQHFGSLALYRSAIVGREYDTPSSFMARITTGLAAYEYRFSPPYSGVGAVAEYSAFSNRQSNWSTDEKIWVRFLVPKVPCLQMRFEGGYATYGRVIPAYFSYQNDWHILGKLTLFKEWTATTYVGLNYTSRYDTMSQISNQGVAIENPTVDIPQNVSNETLFSNRIEGEFRHVFGETFRFEAKGFYEQVNTFYRTWAVQARLEYFF